MKEKGVSGAFDGKKNVYFPKYIGPGFSETFLFELFSEKARQYTVAIKHVTLLNIERDRLQQIYFDTTGILSAVQALDIILRQLPSLNMELIGRSFFSKPRYPPNLGTGRELWSGYYQSLKPVMGWKIMLNLDTAATVFNTEQRIFDFMCLVLRDCHPRDAENPVSDNDRRKFEGRELNDYERNKFSREIKNLKVEVTHLPYPRNYRVNGVTRETTR